jgi:hypothetical protein
VFCYGVATHPKEEERVCKLDLLNHNLIKPFKKMTTPAVVIETPYSGNIEENVKYCWLCMHDSYFNHGEAPVATHLLWTQLSPENHIVQHVPDTEEGRKRAMQRCKELRKKIGKVVFYCDLGMSRGMTQAKQEAEEAGIEIEYRNIGYLKTTPEKSV